MSITDSDGVSGRRSNRYPVPAERVIEVTIGLFDDTEVTPGQVPPVLAADIMADLAREGFIVARHKPHSAPCCVERPLTGWPS